MLPPSEKKDFNTTIILTEKHWTKHRD